MDNVETDRSPTLVAVYTSKGGSSKSTTAANVAAGLVERGYSVLVLDLDPQLSIRHLASSAKEKGAPLPFEVITEWPETTPAEDFLILDHSPRVGVDDRPPEEVSVVLVPVCPGKADMDSLVQAHEVIESYGAKSIMFWSRVDNRSNADKDFIKAQEVEIGETWLSIPSLSGIRSAFNESETVYSKSSPQARRRYFQARAAFDFLVDAVLEKVGLPNFNPTPQTQVAAGENHE